MRSSQKSSLEEVGFGIQKLLLYARVNESGGNSADAIAEMIGELFEEVQSVDVAPDESASAGIWGQFNYFGFQEPHKTRQNSFSLFQKRPKGFSEPTFSWTP